MSPGWIWSAAVSAALDLWPADSIAPSGLEVVGDWLPRVSLCCTLGCHRSPRWGCGVSVPISQGGVMGR